MNFDTPYAVRRVPVLARNMVSASQPLAASAGLRMLAQGGNAIDAVLAAAITLTVVEPTGNGLGSDAFAILWDGAELHGLNASGRSPAAWTPERFAGDGPMPQRGWDSVTVPGAVSAWVALSDKFGALPFETLFGPAIGYARDGFSVSPTIAALWAAGAKILSEQPGFADNFMPGGRAPAAGELYRNEALARTLELIASTKGEAFYRGELAQAIEAAAKANGAVLTAADMANHTADWCGTISNTLRGTTLHEIPPNGQGIAALMAIGILEHLDIEAHHPDSPEGMHLMIEALKLGLADAHAYVSDPATMTMRPDALLDPAYCKSRAALIDPDRAGEPGAGAPKEGGTVYLTAADASGRMISYIQSNYSGFGSGVVVPGTGIHMQNRGFGFVKTPGHPNEVGPNKRPFHTIIPAFAMKDGAPLMSYGVMGGPMQAQGHVQMLVRTMIFGQSPQAASDAPRWRFTSGRGVAVEWDVPAATIEALEAKGHQISREAPDNAFGFGGAQLIMKTDDGYVAGSDHRKDGNAVGF
ncbi:gamma-glutamyltransferase family protein [Acuticoccus sp. MNP-M23]|uniref:gamma-glutamyltransferase family protein n=1 Tax=Acuticoccus sp. MNP-M23 TaxID=3072793 RepID=UPI0028158E82|nr:gamma-glutamyltransferase family protein [Acuticoccus sp. MNP-M23]WMS41523.1 gamma-glutamyltransferase family protein [Acuticoccus sp. MNP-M23]